MSAGEVADRTTGSASPARTAGLPDRLRVLEVVRAGTDGFFGLVTVSHGSASMQVRYPASGSIRRTPAPLVPPAQLRSEPVWTADQAARSTRTAAARFCSR